MQIFETIIIGAGASGCMCALACKSKSIAMLDTGTKLAKKVLVTGNGRCNITNINMDSSYFNQNIDYFLKKFDEKQTLKFFEELGLETYADEEGRVYPISNSAKTVVDILNMNLKNKVNAFMGYTVSSVTKNNSGFIVETDEETFKCKKLVIATGGGTLENIVKSLNVKVKSNIPSLVALKCSNVKDLSGIKLSNVLVTAKNGCGQEKSEMGEVLFKENGLSGIVIFNLSSVFARTGKFEGKIKIDLLPNTSHVDLFKKLKERKRLSVNTDKFFIGMFQNAISNEIFVQSKINTNKNCAKLTDEDINMLVKTIKSLSFDVIGCYENNQVMSGGVELTGLDENLMCKHIPNLYFCGEICDVDGVCGGYNLQWAWTSGYIVGRCV